MADLEGCGAEAEVAQALFGAGVLDRIDVESVERAAGLDGGGEELCVAAEAEGAIDAGFAGAGGEDMEDFLDHDGAVAACGSLAGGDDFGDVVGEAFGLTLLVLVVEVARVFAGIAGSARRALVGREIAQAGRVGGMGSGGEAGIAIWGELAEELEDDFG